jgi:glutathione synthase/RimK-type ligase-like ATP-grasp enzyme
MSSQEPTDIAVLYENAAWQAPLFEVLDRRRVHYQKIDLKAGFISDDQAPDSKIYFNQASPSAYVRGTGHAVPFALELLDYLEATGAKVLNGARAFRLELSKNSQIRIMRGLGIDCPRSVVFNSVDSLGERPLPFPFPAILKPNQGGSGARMYRVDSLEQTRSLLNAIPNLWKPDPVMLLQEELIPNDPRQGIIRIEYLGREFLYAMRVVTNGAFNLCPSETCNPESGDSASECNITPAAAPEFFPCPEVPGEAVNIGARLMEAAGLDVGAVEYLETQDGRRVFYDINANSNLRRPIGKAFGFDPFERVVDFLVAELKKHPNGPGDKLKCTRDGLDVS